MFTCRVSTLIFESFNHRGLSNAVNMHVFAALILLLGLYQPKKQLISD